MRIAQAVLAGRAMLSDFATDVHVMQSGFRERNASVMKQRWLRFYGHTLVLLGVTRKHLE